MKTIAILGLLAGLIGCGGEAPIESTQSTEWYVALANTAPTCQGTMTLTTTAGTTVGAWSCVELGTECEIVRATSPGFSCLSYGGPVEGSIIDGRAALRLTAADGLVIEVAAMLSPKSMAGTATFGDATPFVATLQ